MDYRKMQLISQDPSRVRMMAEKALNSPSLNRKESTDNFLKWLTKYKGDKLLNTRQQEALFSLYQKSTKKAKAGRYSAAKLLKQAYECRFDLNYEEHEEWLEQRVSYRQEVLLSNDEWKRLLCICRILDIIPSDEWIELD